MDGKPSPSCNCARNGMFPKFLCNLIRECLQYGSYAFFLSKRLRTCGQLKF
ncbi:hypothetical protein OP10G_4230 [Fimbriimonas ginsengisoli Gsoil 348]|uniref:Uncharacterized protein n=1 Tax=Fimbriimonas ginsengisoli Gsoil 348 TaxID=661478 RepID=A0A068NVS5_FIMGI|nr:hypothetical protein OP10G_4230 [Fimbriimonas ginsengisoli Gsoil 348]